MQKPSLHLLPARVEQAAGGLSRPGSRRSRSAALVLAAMACALVSVGCSRSEANASKGSGQVVAKVNKEELSVHQLNHLLQRTPGVTAENADAAARAVLERLISQELAIQQAQELKLDRSPAVLQALDAARRDVLARAYLDKMGEGVAKPTPQEISSFYAERPALFRQRKIYNIQEANVQGSPDELASVRERLAGSRTPAEFVGWLRAGKLRHQLTQGTVAAESLPLELLDRMAALPDGQALLLPQGNSGLKVMLLLRSELAPVDEASARPAIEQFITNERRRLKVESDMKALRAAAKVETFGKFAEGAAAPAAPAAPAASGGDGLAGDAVKKGLGLK